MSIDRPAMMPSWIRPSVLFGFVVVAALSRLAPHPPNFTPIGAIALFGGAYFSSRTWAMIVPLAAMLLSDGVFAYARGWEFNEMTVVIYACIAASVWFGFRLRGQVNALSVATNSLLSALLFFAVVNFAVWVAGNLYPKTANGLLACYVAAIPFFGNSLVGYAAYGLGLFGGFELLRRRFRILDLGGVAAAGVAAMRGGLITPSQQNDKISRSP